MEKHFIIESELSETYSTLIYIQIKTYSIQQCDVNDCIVYLCVRVCVSV